MVVGKELIQIEARRNNGEFAQITVLVRTIQLFAFVVRAGYHHIGFPDGPLFLSNSRRHGVVVLNPLFRIAYAGKIVVLVSTQRVSCEHQRCMEVAGNLSGNVSTIGIVSVNDIGNALFGSEEHTSELQSRPHFVCRLLLEKKKIDHTHDVTTRAVRKACSNTLSRVSLTRGWLSRHNSEDKFSFNLYRTWPESVLSWYYKDS